MINKFVENGDQIYSVLLRVQMKNNLIMRKTKYELHGNNTGNTKSRAFNTKDMFMIMKFRYFNNKIDDNKKNDNKKNDNKINNKLVLQYIISNMNFLNNYNKDIFKTEDFIVVSIAKENKGNNIEFYNGLININYELFNYKEITIRLIDNKIIK